jgi:hypothetical protein
MAETSGFWTTSGTPAGHQVAGYTQSHHSKALSIAAAVGRKEGVAVGYLNELKPTVTGANTVSVASGGALVDGKYYENSAVVAVNIPIATSGNTRIDRIVIQATWGSFIAKIVRLTGIDSGSPTPPALTKNTGSVYEIPICQVLVNSSGAVTVTDERSVDLSAMSLFIFGNNSLVAVGDGKLVFPVPESLNGMVLVNADISVTTPSTSGNVSMALRQNTTDLLTTSPVILANAYNSTDTGGTRGVVNGSPVLNTGNMLRFDVDLAGTGAKGLVAHLRLR